MYWTGTSSSHPKPTAELWQNPSSEEHCQNPAPVYPVTYSSSLYYYHDADTRICGIGGQAYTKN